MTEAIDEILSHSDQYLYNANRLSYVAATYASCFCSMVNCGEPCGHALSIPVSLRHWSRPRRLKVFGSTIGHKQKQ